MKRVARGFHTFSCHSAVIETTSHFFLLAAHSAKFKLKYLSSKFQIGSCRGKIKHVWFLDVLTDLGG